jgi:hypothetical protein
MRWFAAAAVCPGLGACGQVKAEPLPFGMVEARGDVAGGSAFTILDQHGMPLPPAVNVPPPSTTNLHRGINTHPALLRQLERFLLDDVLRHECAITGVPAPCDCGVGAV